MGIGLFSTIHPTELRHLAPNRYASSDKNGSGSVFHKFKPVKTKWGVDNPPWASRLGLYEALCLPIIVGQETSSGLCHHLGAYPRRGVRW